MNENELLKELTKLIFLYRKKRKYTLTNLAKEIGCDSQFLRNLELGRHSTQVDNYLKLARKLEIPTEEIVKIIKNYYS